jgi:hypothetical protein
MFEHNFKYYLNLMFSDCVWYYLTDTNKYSSIKMSGLDRPGAQYNKAKYFMSNNF